MAEEKKEEAAAPSTPPAGGGSKLPLILGGVNLIATLAIVGLLVVSFKKENTGPKVEDIAVESPGGEHGGAAKEGEHGGGHGEAKPADGHGEKKADAGHGGGGHGDKKETVREDFGKMVTLEQFTVNLSTTGSVTPKFARVNISLEVKTPDTESEVGQKMPRIRNTIIDLFNSKRPTDLANPEGRNYLKEEIGNAINSFLVTGKISGVFFTNFALGS